MIVGADEEGRSAAEGRRDEDRACRILEACLQRGQALKAAFAGARTTQDDGMTAKKGPTTPKDDIHDVLSSSSLSPRRWVHRRRGPFYE